MDLSRHYCAVAILLAAIILFGCSNTMQSTNEPLASDIQSDISSDIVISSSAVQEHTSLESAVLRAEEILSQFTENRLLGNLKVFANTNGYVLEQKDKTFNQDLAIDFLQSEWNASTELVVLRHSERYDFDYVYLLNRREDSKRIITVACNEETVTYEFERYEDTDNEIILYATEHKGAYLPLYIGKNGSSGYTRFCHHQNWEHLIDTKLIAYVGEYDYLQWMSSAAQDSLNFQRCEVNIYDFLKAFSIDYDTFIQAIKSNKQNYNLDKIKQEVYPDYFKLTTDKTSPEEIGRLCFEAYMNNQMHNKAEDGTQVLSYEINNIKLLAGDIEEFAVWIEYDYTVSLTDEGSSIYAAANGTYDGKGSITGAYREMRIKRVGTNTYAVQGVGTGGYAMGLKPV